MDLQDTSIDIVARLTALADADTEEGAAPEPVIALTREAAREIERLRQSPDQPGLRLMRDGQETWCASGPEQALWESLSSMARAQYMNADQQQAMHAIEQAVLGRPMPWNVKPEAAS